MHHTIGIGLVKADRDIPQHHHGENNTDKQRDDVFDTHHDKPSVGWQLEVSGDHRVCVTLNADVR